MTADRSPLERALRRVSEGEAPPVLLIHGDLVLAEPAAERVAAALAKRASTEPRRFRRPAAPEELFEDLVTFSLFGGGKVTVAVDTALLADRAAAAELLAETFAVLPMAAETELSRAEREAASRLLQVIHLFGLDPLEGTAETVLAELPDWVFRPPRARRGRTGERREQLVPLLEAARREGLRGVGERAVSRLAELVRGGLPSGHHLVLVERSAAPDHPLVETLGAAGAVVEVGKVASERRGGWSGLEELAAELERQTGTAIAPAALSELARRTLRQEGGRRGGDATTEGTARFAAEYRKLAELAGDSSQISVEMVRETVEDRGEEDAFELLDAVAEGRGGEALARLRRLLASAEDPVAARLAFFSLLASFCRQLVAVAGVLERLDLPVGERSYPRFKQRLAPTLSGPLPGGHPNPLGGLHPFRLHRAYLAASRLPSGLRTGLPARVLETELALKGESRDPESALGALLAELAAALGRG